MKKIMLFVLVWFSLMLFGCNSQSSNNEDQNIVEEINEETIVLEEANVVEDNNTTTEQVNNKPVEKPVVNNVSATEALAKCLTAKWIKMYGTETCPYCLQQKDMFWGDFKHITYINCGETPAICGQANIQWVPAWELADGSQKAGLQSLENLAALAGCEYVW
jgi:hypothetical protein